MSEKGQKWYCALCLFEYLDPFDEVVSDASEDKLRDRGQAVGSSGDCFSDYKKKTKRTTRTRTKDGEKNDADCGDSDEAGDDDELEELTAVPAAARWC